MLRAVQRTCRRLVNDPSLLARRHIPSLYLAFPRSKPFSTSSFRRLSSMEMQGDGAPGPGMVEVGKRKEAPIDLEEVDSTTKKNRLSSASPEVQVEALNESGQQEKTNKAQGKSKGKGRISKRQKKKLMALEPGSHDDIFWQEVQRLLGPEYVQEMIDTDKDFTSPLAFHDEVEVNISELSSNGEGLGLFSKGSQQWVVVVPFSLPGETVSARVYRNARLHSFGDLLEVKTANSELRYMSRVRCRYFGRCGGCQYQMLAYEKQLEFKQRVVVKAYEVYSGLPEKSVPAILPTAPSPLQYNYRTKITPHFEALDNKKRRGKANSMPAEKSIDGDGVPPVDIGFNQVGTKRVIDIEECPIAVDVINQALGPVRENIQKNIHTYKRGVSLLLRTSLRIPPDETNSASSSKQTYADGVVVGDQICITDHRSTVRERVGDMLFDYPASSFFQNNNSVLVPLVDSVKTAIFGETASGVTSKTPTAQDPAHLSISAADSEQSRSVPTHLVDAYCGSGLFSIMLSPYFETIAGIELSKESIASATHNAALNGLPARKVTFRSGDAAAIFDVVSDFPPDRTAVIIDPPRKGSDEKFLDQLLALQPAIVVYVSCNVHTQARDIGHLIRKSEGDGRQSCYVLESVRGFDLFPQTAHVESLAVLRLVTV